jgi:hypothetical protein
MIPISGRRETPRCANAKVNPPHAGRLTGLLRLSSSVYDTFLFKYPNRLRRRCAAKTPKHPPRNPAGAAPAGAAEVFVLLYTQERGRAMIRAARAPQSIFNAVIVQQQDSGMPIR